MIPQLYDKFQEWAKYGTIWIISDTHFGDDELRQGIPGRPSDNELVKLINSKVGRKDTLIHLGDVGDLSYVQKLRAGRKVLIMGNHDSGASNYQHKREIVHVYDDEMTFEVQENDEKPWDRDIKAGFIDYVYFDSQHSPFISGWKDNHLFDEVYEGPVIIGPKLILSHEPILNFPIMFNIHGHVHCQAHNIPQHLNACLDVTDYQPIHFNSLMKSGIFKDIDDIHRVTIDTAIKRTQRKEKQSIPKYKKYIPNRN